MSIEGIKVDNTPTVPNHNSDQNNEAIMILYSTVQRFLQQESIFIQALIEEESIEKSIKDVLSIHREDLNTSAQNLKNSFATILKENNSPLEDKKDNTLIKDEFV